MEEWRVVPSLPFVWASSEGRIRIGPYRQSMPNGGKKFVGGKARSGSWDGTRYNIVIRRQTYRVAKLVCQAFNGPPPIGKPNCLHKDENARNNRPSNLKWGTQKENLNAPGFLAYCRARKKAS